MDTQPQDFSGKKPQSSPLESHNELYAQGLPLKSLKRRRGTDIGAHLVQPYLVQSQPKHAEERKDIKPVISGEGASDVLTRAEATDSYPWLRVKPTRTMKASSICGIGEGKAGQYIGLPRQFMPTRRAKSDGPDGEEGDFDGDDEDEDERTPQRSQLLGGGTPRRMNTGARGAPRKRFREPSQAPASKRARLKLDNPDEAVKNYSDEDSDEEDVRREAINRGVFRHVNSPAKGYGQGPMLPIPSVLIPPSNLYQRLREEEETLSDLPKLSKGWIYVTEDDSDETRPESVQPTAAPADNQGLRRSRRLMNK